MRCPRRGDSFFSRSPASALAVFEAAKPAVCFCRSEHAPIAVAAVRILAKPARTLRRHRTAHQRQTRCFAQEVDPSRNLPCRLTANDTRRDLDRAEIARAAWALGIGCWSDFLREVIARNFAKQLFQYFDQDGLPAIGMASRQRTR